MGIGCRKKKKVRFIVIDHQKKKRVRRIAIVRRKKKRVRHIVIGRRKKKKVHYIAIGLLKKAGTKIYLLLVKSAHQFAQLKSFSFIALNYMYVQ